MWLPIFLWFGGIACVAMQIFLQVKNIENPNFGPYSWAKVHMQVGPGIVFLPFLASTIVLNAYCTGEFVEMTLALSDLTYFSCYRTLDMANLEEFEESWEQYFVKATSNSDTNSHGIGCSLFGHHHRAFRCVFRPFQFCPSHEWRTRES